MKVKKGWFKFNGGLNSRPILASKSLFNIKKEIYPKKFSCVCEYIQDNDSMVFTVIALTKEQCIKTLTAYFKELYSESSLEDMGIRILFISDGDDNTGSFWDYSQFGLFVTEIRDSDEDGACIDRYSELGLLKCIEHGLYI